MTTNETTTKTDERATYAASSVLNPDWVLTLALSEPSRLDELSERAAVLADPVSVRWPEETKRVRAAMILWTLARTNGSCRN